MTNVSAVNNISISEDEYSPKMPTFNSLIEITEYTNDIVNYRYNVPLKPGMSLIDHFKFDFSTNPSISRPKPEILNKSTILKVANDIINPANIPDEEIFIAMVQHDLDAKMPPKNSRIVKINITQRIKGSPLKSNIDDII